MAAAAERPPNVVKLELFLIHSITTGHPLAIMLQQSLVSTTVKVRLTERIGRLMLAAYVGCSSPDLLLNEAVSYVPRYHEGAGDT